MTEASDMKIMFVTMPDKFAHEAKVLRCVKELCENWEGPNKEHGIDMFYFLFVPGSEALEAAEDAMARWQELYEDVDVEVH